jgi:hypothetical protein
LTKGIHVYISFYKDILAQCRQAKEILRLGYFEGITGKALDTSFGTIIYH